MTAEWGDGLVYAPTLAGRNKWHSIGWRSVIHLFCDSSALIAALAYQRTQLHPFCFYLSRYFYSDISLIFILVLSRYITYAKMPHRQKSVLNHLNCLIFFPLYLPCYTYIYYWKNSILTYLQKKTIRLTGIDSLKSIIMIIT